MSTVQKHSWSTLIFCVSRVFERTSYYGMRAIMVLFLLEEYFNNDFTTTLSAYAFFTLLVALAAPIGGLLGDFVLKNKLAIIIGGGLQAIGILFFLGADQLGVYLPFFIVAIGNGLYRPNFLAMFGKLYLNKPRTIEAGFTIQYLAVNLGAFIGILLIGLIADEWSYEIALVIAAGFMVLATVCAVFFKQVNAARKRVDEPFAVLDEELIDDQLVQSKIPKPGSVGNKVLLLIVAMVGAIFFWGMYELLQAVLSAFRETIGFGNLRENALAGQNIQSIVMIVCAVAAVLVWTFVYFNKFIKLAIGIFCLGAAFLFTLLHPFDPGAYTWWAISFAVLIGLAEIHIAPVLHSAIVQNVGTRYLAIAMSIGLLIASLSAKLFSLITSELDDYIWEYPTFMVIFPAIVVIIVSIPILVLGLIRSKKMRLD